VHLPCEFGLRLLFPPTYYVLFSAKHLRSRDRAVNNHNYPRVHFPEVYILEGGYCQYFKESGARCKPPGYVRMDDPNHVASRKEDMDHFRKATFGRTKSYAYGDAIGLRVSKPRNQSNNNNATQPAQLFATATANRVRSCGVTSDNGLGVVPEDCHILLSEDEETDIGDSPCPPQSKNAGFKPKKLGLGGRGQLMRAETWTSSGFL
jgi:M-phase inducer tyrosine phosphatase